MPKFLRVAKKEFLDMFRDRRSIIRMMLIPLIAFPIIINLVVTIQSSVSESAAKEELKIGYILNGEDEKWIKPIKETQYISLVAYTDKDKMRADVKNEKINMGIRLEEGFESKFLDNKTPNIFVDFRGAEMEEKDRLDDILDTMNDSLVQARLKAQSIDTSIIQAFEYRMPIVNGMPYNGNTSEKQEIIGKYAGGFLPYIFIAFLFMGCMYPAIDLFAGEKERGTMETLLTTPVHRTQILLGKMIVILSFGLLSATLALTGLFLSLNIIDINAEMMAVINDILSPTLILTLYVLLIPLAIFFTGLMTPISIYAKSYKEAQSTMVPLNIIVVLPAVAGFIPGIELNYVTAFIPIVNVVLATKQIIAGNMDIILVGITFISLVLLAAISVAISYKQFGKESNILRGD